MKTSIATVSLSGELSDKLTAIAAAGFDGVEIFENDFLAFDRSPRDVGRMVSDAGLAVTLFQPFRDFEGLPEPLRAKAFDRAQKRFDLMQELGAGLLLICSSVSSAALGGIDRAAADLHELGERAAERGLRIGYEALAWGRFVNDHRDAWEIVRRADHPNVGIILDSFHSLARKIPSDSIRAIPKDKIAIVQLADAPLLDLDLLSWSRHFRSMPGQGDLPVAEFLAAVEATGYDSYLSLEIFNDRFRAGSARAVAVDGRRSLIHLADRVGKAGEVALPPPARCLGIEFIEFAVEGASAGELEAALSSLGFRQAARHRSKDVRLWRQGGVNIVVNAEQDGFAHSFYLTHGPGVCALCLRVEDARAAMERAGRLLATPFSQRVLDGELHIPAIRGVGGSLIYFVDPTSELGSLWETDFVALSGADASPAALSIDHVSQSMDYDEMLSWLLFYTAILAVDRASGQDVADPAGLVRSQVVQSKDGALKLVLNASQGGRTMPACFISEFFGSGVQHIALATDDLLAFSRRLKSLGFATLPIPRNYYDDLLAKYDIDEAFVETLAEHGILYDRDADGAFLQIYTKTLFDRFFFEIVERRDYAGFGAANAPIRLSAQARLARQTAD